MPLVPGNWSGRQVRAALAVFLVALLLAAAFVFRKDILRTALDPKVPFQTYDPPPAPDYGKASAWALLPGREAPVYQGAPPVDVFFIHPTTFNGGAEWNGPVNHPRADKVLNRVMIPNYAGPYYRVGRVFAPRYRQGSLYTQLTGREDAREARRLAYEDVRAAFGFYLQRLSGDRPFLIVGVEQGASIGARLLNEAVAPDPALRRRLVAAHLIGAIAPADAFGPRAPVPACAAPAQPGCVLAYLEAPPEDDARAERLRRRALVWNDAGRLEPLGERAALCVNPLLGAATERPAPPVANLGAVNAANLEWGLRPAFLPHQAGARCRGGILEVTAPKSPTLKPANGWIERSKAPQFNLFYADLEADALRRARTWLSASSQPAVVQTER
ncbi:MAG TPA: DUF3089 domain-containing protein [Caulobacteraceae bacterium]|jgi:hypothetical protein